MTFKIKDGVRIGTVDVFNNSAESLNVKVKDTTAGGTKTVAIETASLGSSNYTQTLQAKTGIIALTNDIPNNWGTAKIDNTDTEYTWVTTDASTAVAETSSDTLTFVAAKTGSTYGIQVKVDATNDAIGIAHADTSTQASVDNSGNTFIQDITLDEFGHITEIGSAGVDFTVAANYAFANVSIGADAGYTWGTANTNTTQAADSNSDTITIVAGKTGSTAGIDLFTNTVAGTDAIKIAHADTSALSGAQGSGGIASITVDEMGHVTAVTTATYLTTAKNIVGASATATADAVATNGNVYLNHLSNGSVSSAHKIVGAGGTTVTSDASGYITITSTDTNTDTLQSVSDDTTNADRFIHFVINASGAQTAGSSANFKFNPSTSTLLLGGAAGTSPVINTTSTGSASVFNTNATTGNLFGAGTTVNIGANSGILTLRNPTVVGTQASVNLWNTVSTSVNFAGVGTTVNIGANSGILTLRNPTVVGTQASVNLWNTVSTSVNFAGVGTTVNIGANSGTLTLRNPTVVGTQTSVDLWNTVSTTVNFAGAATSLNIGAATGDTTVKNNLVVAGNLTVNGTSSIINSTVTSLDDPVLILGGDTSTVETSKDRGIEAKWNGTALTITNYIGNGTTTVTGTVTSTTGYAAGDIITISGATGTEQSKLNGTWKIASVPNGTTFTFVVTSTVASGTYTTTLGTTVKSKDAFFGLDQTTGKWTFIPQANNNGEVFSGTTGEIDAKVDWSNVLNSPNNWGTAKIDNTDTEYTWVVTDASTAVADTSSDTLTFVAAKTGSSYGIQVKVDATNDAIGIAHADTSSQPSVNNSGNTFIQDITLDEFGHITAIGSAGVDFTVAANFAFANVSIGADSGYTWGTANTNTTQAADSNSDTLTIVSGLTGSTAGIDLYTNTVAGTDAIKIAHAKTSTISGTKGSNGVASVTIDEMGHVTGVTTATYLTSESTDFKTVTVTDTDSGYTWADNGSAVAETVGDTLTIVSGPGVEIDVDAAKDALRIRSQGAAYAYSDAITLTNAAPVANTAFNLDSWTKASYRAIKYVIGVTQGTTLYQTSEIMVFNDGTTSGQMTEYAVFSNDPAKEVTYTVDFSGTTAYLKVATPTASSITFNIHRTFIAA